MKYLTGIILLISFSVFAQNKEVETFAKAKRNLKKLYNKTSLERKTIYCGCDFNNKKIDTKSCGFKLKKKVKNGKIKEMYSKRIKVEWEHLVPASKFQVFFPECIKRDKKGSPLRDKKGNLKTIGRSKCKKVSPEYNLMISDMYNLYPSVGSLNAHRSNLSFGEINGEKREWGNCNFEIKNRKVEPRDEIKGLIARNYKYMEQAYGVKLISNKNKKLFDVWDKMYPASEEECKRYKLIKKIQTSDNPVLSKVCK